MNYRILKLAAALWVATSALGCSTKSSGPVSYTATTFCSALTAKTAQRERECQGGPVEILESLPGAATFCADMAAAIAAGRIQYAGGTAAACLNAISAATCASFVTLGHALPPACVPVFQGTVAAGATCYSSVDCANSGVCSIPNTFPTPACEGTCVATVPVGQPCMSTDVCASGGTCTGSPAVCTPAAATPPPAFVQKGESCASDPNSSAPAPVCEPTTTCDPATKTCIAFVHEGDPCTPGHGMCENFTSCEGSRCVRWSGDAGAMCGASDAGDGIGCIPPVYCAIHSTIAGTGLCTALLPEGASCGDYSVCQSRTCGLSGSATCGPAPPYCPQL